MKPWIRRSLENTEEVLRNGLPLLEIAVSRSMAEKWIEDSCDAVEKYIKSINEEIYLNYILLTTLLKRNKNLTPKQWVARSQEFLIDALDYLWEELE